MQGIEKALNVFHALDEQIFIIRPYLRLPVLFLKVDIPDSFHVKFKIFPLTLSILIYISNIGVG